MNAVKSTKDQAYDELQAALCTETHMARRLEEAKAAYDEAMRLYAAAENLVESTYKKWDNTPR